MMNVERSPKIMDACPMALELCDTCDDHDRRLVRDVDEDLFMDVAKERSCADCFSNRKTSVD